MEALMETTQIVSWLYDKAARAHDHSYARMLNMTAKRLRELDEKQKWIPVTERLPENFISVLGYMTDAGDFPPVRECYTVGNAFFFPALSDVHPVSHWMPLPEPPKEVDNG
jgi:hypothetical protein